VYHNSGELPRVGAAIGALLFMFSVPVMEFLKSMPTVESLTRGTSRLL